MGPGLNICLMEVEELVQHVRVGVRRLNLSAQTVSVDFALAAATKVF